MGSVEAEPRWGFLWGDFSRDCSQKKPDGGEGSGTGRKPGYDAGSAVVTTCLVLWGAQEGEWLHRVFCTCQGAGFCSPLSLAPVNYPGGDPHVTDISGQGGFSGKGVAGSPQQL